jgi:hypothetical protein
LHSTSTLKEATGREELVPENLAAEEQLNRHEPAGHDQGQFAIPKDGGKRKGIPLRYVSHGFGISSDPDHAGVQPQRRQEKGRNGEFQSRKEDRQKVSGKGFKHLLVGSLDAIEGPGMFAGTLCCFNFVFGSWQLSMWLAKEKRKKRGKTKCYGEMDVFLFLFQCNIIYRLSLSL